MARTPLVVGNWKMELSHKAAVECARAIKKLLSVVDVSADVVVCPSFPSLPEVAEIFQHSEKVQVGAQHAHWEEKGAFTGAVSVLQVSPFARWCIVGHSEQRRLGVSEEAVRDTANLLLRHGLAPIVCIGESWEEHEREETFAKITGQMEMLFAQITRTAISKLVIAYEPIWAISTQHTGEAPDPQAVSEIVLLIRKLTATRFDGEAAQRLRVIYGGSVTSDNAPAYLGEPGVDGVLAGHASVNPVQFVEIVKAVQTSAQ